MILYSDRDDHYSQRVRIVLAEKDISAEIKESKQDETADEILSISPYHKLPILVDRDLAIHDPAVMMEYLDERFPHPPLLPVYPVARANSRTLMLRIDREWCPLIDTLIEGAKPEKELMKITNHTESKWCGETTIIIVNSIKGALKGLQMCGDPTQNSVRDMIICIIFSICSFKDLSTPTPI